MLTSLFQQCHGGRDKKRQLHSCRDQGPHHNDVRINVVTNPHIPNHGTERVWTAVVAPWPFYFRMKTLGTCAQRARCNPEPPLAQWKKENLLYPPGTESLLPAQTAGVSEMFYNHVHVATTDVLEPTPRTRSAYPKLSTQHGYPHLALSQQSHCATYRIRPSPIWEANKFETQEDTANVFLIYRKYTECRFTWTYFEQNITQVAALNIDKLM